MHADSSEYIKKYNAASRNYSVWDRTPDEIAEWHQQVLSQPPWSIIKVDRDVFAESDTVYTEYCIQAYHNKRKAVYFWEIAGTDRNTLVDIDVSTPNPVSDTCLRHVE